MTKKQIYRAVAFILHNVRLQFGGEKSDAWKKMRFILHNVRLQLNERTEALLGIDIYITQCKITIDVLKESNEPLLLFILHNVRLQ